MVGELPVDVVGTNPQHQPLVDHTWLAVDLSKYKNFPSDNNPVRIGDKLSDLWNPDLKQTGMTLVPNAPAHPHGCQAPRSASSEVVREAKKAMMAGLSGKGLAEHLRARFAAQDIASAKDGLKALASEQGLLGNVYIDASAFASAKEAEEFLSKHRGRLAQDIVVAESKINRDTISVLANRFRKNVVASVSYDVATLAKYKNHLVATGKIGNDFVVDSKETLRAAFLAPPKEPIMPQEKAPAAAPSQEQVQDAVTQTAEASAKVARVATDEVNFSRVKAIVAWAREQMAKGKSGSDLKDMLRGKYATEDLKIAAKYLAVVSSDERVASAGRLADEGKISDKTAAQLVEIARANPFKKDLYAAAEGSRVERSVGVQAVLYTPASRKESSGAQKVAVEALCAGNTPDQVYGSLCKSMAKDEAVSTLTAAMNEFNSMPSGKRANTFKPAAKEKLVEDLPERKTLPDESTIQAGNQEFTDFFAGSTGDIQVDAAPARTASLGIDCSFNRDGMDSVL